MEYTRLTKEYFENKLLSGAETIEGHLYELINNYLINLRVCYKIINNNNLLDIELMIYIQELIMCHRCETNNYRDINCLRCKYVCINLDSIGCVKLVKKDEYYNGKNINYILNIILELSNKALYYINLTKRCKNCVKYICNDKIVCEDCYWQQVYNTAYGKLLPDICCICYENIYIADAVTVCGETKHSIHRKCNKELERCPCCKEYSILVNGLNRNTINVYENILYENNIGVDPSLYLDNNVVSEEIIITINEENTNNEDINNGDIDF